MVKLKHTDPDVRGFSHEGAQYPMDDRGMIEVPVHVLSAAHTHGYVRLTAEEENALKDPGPVRLTAEIIKGMSKKDLLAYCSENGIDTPDKATIDVLRAAVMEYEGLTNTTNE